MRTNSHFVALKSGGYAYLSYPLKLRLYVCVWWMLRVTTWRCLTYPVVSRCPASHWRSPWTCWSPRLYTRAAALAHRGAAAPHRWVVSSWWCCCQESTFCTSARRTSPASHALSMYHHSITAHHSVAEKLSDVFQSIPPLHLLTSSELWQLSGGNIIRTVLRCVVYGSCAQWYAHKYEQFLNLRLVIGLSWIKRMPWTVANGERW